MRYHTRETDEFACPACGAEVWSGQTTCASCGRTVRWSLQEENVHETADGNSGAMERITIGAFRAGSG